MSNHRRRNLWTLGGHASLYDALSAARPLSDKQLRLFACGTVRHLIAQHAGKRGVLQPTRRVLARIDRAEAMSWQRLDHAGRSASHESLFRGLLEELAGEDRLGYAALSEFILDRDAWHAAAAVARHKKVAEWQSLGLAVLRDLFSEPGRDLARDMGHFAGDDFRTPDVLGLARAARKDRLACGFLDPAVLKALSDALEEAGCRAAPGRTLGQVIDAQHSAVTGGCCDRFADHMACDCLAESWPDGPLEHLRGRGPHFLGCWVVEEILKGETP